MSLRQQLLAVSLLLLCLPWAGCQFVREMENTLREAQAAAVSATASAVAASLRDRAELLYLPPVRQVDRSEPDRRIHVERIDAPVIVDGYAEEWRAENSSADSVTASGSPPGSRSLAADDFALTWAARERGDTLYLLLQVRDPSINYSSRDSESLRPGDRVILHGLRGGRDRVQIATSAPGRVRAAPLAGGLSLADARRIRGYWQDTAGGYTLELALPLSIAGTQLGITVIDADSERALSTLPVASGPVPWLVRQPPELAQALSRFSGPATALEVTDRDGFIVGAAKARPAQSSVEAGGGDETFWLLRALYRAMLSEPPRVPDNAATGGRRQDTLTGSALAGDSDSAWLTTGDGRAARIAAVAPVFLGGNAIGSVRVTQDSERYLALADRAVGRLLGITLAALALVLAGLLGYASLLGWRIRRLERAAAAVADRRGAIARAFPRSGARDEIGELSRRFADLLEQVDGYNRYLSLLARRLGHELRTPIAIIQSSLDNLEQVAAEERTVYLQRAREGLGRLGYILAAMSEASRLEESIAASRPENVPLVPLLRNLAGAYSDSGARPVELIVDAGEDALCARVAPETLVQALDKLVDNAQGFASGEAPIRLILTRKEAEVCLGVSNRGPLLDPALASRLFEPMVSQRPAGERDATHLGLGLHIVQLVAQHAGGSVRAENLADGSGVCVTLCLPATTSATAGKPAA
jgi:dedicated sortase system histidine kinase